MPEPSLSKSRRRGSRSKGDVEKGRLRVHDPFELIRWLALSQPDPRKALAELVQNSLDAGAHHIRITRARESRRPCLRIMDDGEGVIPEMDRSEALKYIATHIGHSRKRSLSPQQRLELMTQGQYGIGLLGFWSLGETLEMRTSMPGQEPHRLVLKKDCPKFEIGKLHGRLAFDERWTEVVVTGLNHEAITALGARRAADYLASELRGQLLARDVDLVMEDKMARGRSPKFIAVKPSRFLGERLEGLGPVQVPGHPPIRMEIYLLGEETEDSEPRGIGLYAAGTMAAERFEDLAALALDHLPWTDRRLTGLVEFPGLQVAPGSRRGVVPNESAAAFVEALLGAEPILNNILEAREQERAEKLDKNLIRDLQRAFRDFYRHRPRYSMLPIQAENDADGGPVGTETDTDQKGGDEAITRAGLTEALPESPPPQEELFPPGPLEHVEIIPSRLRMECDGTRSVKAKATDAAGRPLRAPEASVQFSWELWGHIGSFRRDQVSLARSFLLRQKILPKEFYRSWRSPKIDKPRLRCRWKCRCLFRPVLLMKGFPSPSWWITPARHGARACSMAAGRSIQAIPTTKPTPSVPL